ncbi:condensation domain-containing protein [Ruminiclostridium papyrosolvens]|uniref:Condensation protein n=1 Tax=Ruminiclostridium papyrosolvens C7 TaxID=1330534 RepID=U4R6N4_9FIRM|nr:condensation domain-containing protein [Ruminiclostridium papyrosolvens]EPR13626.1 condensation protein [Ruminiclostridium papyrosolvens C7]
MKDIYKNNKNNYNKMIQSVTRYYKDYTKLLEKNFMEPQHLYNEEDRAGTFPANGHDIYNYVARYNMANLQIQAIMKLDGRLDFDKLKQAVKLSIVVEPILGCRFIEDRKPYWKPLDNINMIDFCTFEETENIDQAIHNFIRDDVDLDFAPMVNVRLIRSGRSDVLAIKMNHACCDGIGTQEYVQLLADIYTKLNQKNGTFEPEPRIAGRKDQDRMFAELGITNQDAIFIPGSDICMPTWPFPWEQSGSNTILMSVSRLHSGHLEEISKYAKSLDATVNDYILTAYYRAMLEMGQPIYGVPMEIPVTIDLRRYLPDHKTMAIRNFSGSVNTRLIMLINEPFNRTLKRVSNMMKKIKKGYPGLQSAIGLERLENINFKETLAYYQADTSKTQSTCPLYFGDKCVPTLSNLGILSKSLISFGNNTVIDAFILPPVVRAPGLLLMTSTYNSVLTLAVGYYKSTVSKENIDRLLSLIKNELIQGYKS